MRTYRYLHLDVFTERVFAGNQLAVVLDAEGLSDSEMQAIAFEMNFSETTFVLPFESRDTDARVRIFTPFKELPMAGHPTIGTTFALALERRIDPARAAIVLGLGVGPTRVALEWSGGVLRFAWMRQAAPTFVAQPADLASLAAALGISERSIRDTGLPSQVVSSGTPFLFVPLTSRSAVNACVADVRGLRAFYRAAGLDDLPVYVFTLDLDRDPDRAHDDATVYSRMFAPFFGIPEDPGTGSAGGPLGGYLVQHRAISDEQAGRIVTLQGDKMRRPCRIQIAVRVADGRILDVQVGGMAVLVGDGTLRL